MRPPALLALALALAAALAAGLPGCGGDTPAAPAGRPNVVVVCIDTLRADWLEVYGREEATSPRLSELAARAVVFEDASAPAPWTLPSVVSYLTGRFPAEHGVVRDGQRLDERLPTLAEALRDCGYATASFVKNPYAGAMSGLDRGFDAHERVRKQVEGADVAAWLASAPPGPKLLYVHNSQPHEPIKRPEALETPFGTVPAEAAERFLELKDAYRRLTRVDFAARQPLGTTDTTAAQEEALRGLTELQGEVHVAYSEAVREADRVVGEIVDALREAGEWERTLFVLVSDHGEEMADHGGWQHDQSVYEELVHVPFVVRLPGDALGGRRVPEPVSLVDLVPTVLDVAGCPPLEGVAGRSLLPAIAGAPPADEMRVTSMRINEKKYFRPYKETRGDVNVVVREGRWKCIANLELRTAELYDLAADPGERHDLAEVERDRARRMYAFARDEFEAARARGARAAEDDPAAAPDEDALEGLRAMGYVGD